MSKLVVLQTQSEGILKKLLNALDVELHPLPLRAVLEGDVPAGSSLLLSESEFLEIRNGALTTTGKFRRFAHSFRSILIYPCAGNSDALLALSELVGAQVTVSRLSGEDGWGYSISGSREMCGPFRGLQVEGVDTRSDFGTLVTGAVSEVEYIVAGPVGGLLTRFRLANLDLFFCSTSAVYDIDAEHNRNLDVARCFSGLVPLLFFLRHNQIGLPQVSLNWANWIIDDPNLRPRYGFLDTKALAACVRNTRSAATIAFIPWNYTRTSSEIVNLFRSEWPQLSICLHGCDHTGSEFATKSATEAASLADLATKRMRALKGRTSLSFERIMVFPQGRFSGPAMSALRQSDILAAVNTELIDEHAGTGVKGFDLLRPAISSFSGFPLFMRRPAEADPANFALDILLGKPCLIVTHHQYFKEGLQALESTVGNLKSMAPEMVWTNLEHGISSTYSILPEEGGEMKIRLYAPTTNILGVINSRVHFSKIEPDGNDLEIFINGESLTGVSVGREVGVSIANSEGEDLRVEFRLTGESQPEYTQSQQYRLKVAGRRYLTEVRDNYLSRLPRVAAGAASLQKLMFRNH